MDERLRELLDAVPAVPPRSKLEPYHALIRELRRKRCTYQQVAKFFADRLGISVAPSTIHAFVAVRAKRGRKVAYELPPLQTEQTQREERAQATAAPADPIEVLRRRPPAQPIERPRFDYAEGEGLKLPASKKAGH